MEAEAIPELRLGPGDEAEIAALVARVFATDFGGQTFFQQRHHLRLLVREGGRVLGHVALTWRAVRLGATLVVVGLAEVATDPGRRGEGIGSVLLGTALAEAAPRPARHGLLFGETSLYARQDLRPAANPIRHVDLGGAWRRRMTPP